MPPSICRDRRLTTAIQQMAAMCRAELVGQRLACIVGSEETFRRAIEDDPAERTATYWEALFSDLETLDPADEGAVKEFIAEHFADEVSGMSDEQMAACAKEFAHQIKDN